MIPDFQTLMLPVLKVASKGETRIGDAILELSKEFNLSPEERAALIPSGRQTTFANRTHWAKSYLAKAGLLEATGRGRFKITPEGTQVLASNPEKINIRFLEKFSSFRDFQNQSRAPAIDEATPAGASVDVENTTLAPDEAMRSAQQKLEEALGGEILDRLVAAPPEFFERAVVKLLATMGYGGSVAEAARALGRSGDGGVDGVIDQDALGLDRVYVQAKRYAQNNPVGAGAIRDFFGSLDRFKATKGLFVTTSSFTQSARETSEYLSKRIVLIDGVQLTKLMIRHEVGCRTEETLFIKKLDEEFFE